MARPLSSCANPDPIIRTIHRLIMDGNVEIGDLNRRSGIGHDTLRTWFTRRCRPNMENVNAVLKVLGHRLVVEPMPPDEAERAARATRAARQDRQR